MLSHPLFYTKSLYKILKMRGGFEEGESLKFADFEDFLFKKEAM